MGWKARSRPASAREKRSESPGCSESCSFSRYSFAWRLMSASLWMRTARSTTSTSCSASTGLSRYRKAPNSTACIAVESGGVQHVGEDPAEPRIVVHDEHTTVVSWASLQHVLPASQDAGH